MSIIEDTFVGGEETVVASFVHEEDEEESREFALTEERFIHLKGDEAQTVTSICHGSSDVYGTKIEKNEGDNYNMLWGGVGGVICLIGMGLLAVDNPGGAAIIVLLGLLTAVVGFFDTPDDEHELTFLFAEADNRSFELPEAGEDFVDVVHQELGKL